jgi:tetratricopeptide (TPR) repeat protein
MNFEEATFGPYQNAERKARKAFELYEEGQISQALVKIEEALEINPSNSAWHFNKALSLDSINRFEDAIKEYETALQLNPDDPEILNSIAVDYTRVGQYDLAINIFEQIQQIAPDFEPCYCNRIITYTEMSCHDLAEQMFYLAQQIDSDCPICFYNIGNSLFIRGKYSKAVNCWQKTAELEPSHPQINYRIAQAYWSQGNEMQAHEHFLIELRYNPGDIDVILDFGLFLLQTGNVNSAQEKFNRILELEPDYPPALFYLGEIAFDNAEYSLAVKWFNRALTEDKTLKGPAYRLAQCALIRKDLQQTKAYLLSELELVPEDSDVLVSMGTMFLQLKCDDYADHCFMKALEFDFTNAHAHYHLGLTSAIHSQFDDAIQFFSHTLDINSKYMPALRDSALAYLYTGSLNKAMERISKAKSICPKDMQLKKISHAIRLANIKERINETFTRFKMCHVFRK